MIPSLSASSNLFLVELSRVQTTIDTTTQQVTSGYRINQPSDAPDQISPLLQLQANLNQNRAISQNLTVLQPEVASADQAIGSAIQLLDQALSAGAQGANGTATSQSRAILAQQVQSLQQQMVSLASTQVSGNYIFSGDQPGSPSYALDLTQTNGVQRLITPAATRQIQLAGNSTMSVDQTAQNLFDQRYPDDTYATGNVFAALNSLRVALLNNDQAGVVTAQTSLETASTYLNSQEGFFGNAQNRIAASVTQLSSENTTLQQQISAIRDTNTVQAALTLTSAETQNQAALTAEGKLPHTSLFDFLG